MAVTVQYVTKGSVNEWLLDMVEVAWSHTGAQLMAEFANVLDEFGIAKKVSEQNQVILHENL